MIFMFHDPQKTVAQLEHITSHQWTHGIQGICSGGSTMQQLIGLKIVQLEVHTQGGLSSLLLPQHRQPPWLVWD
jgi:hypothetical protein